MNIPDEIFENDALCADFLISIQEKLARVASMDKELREAKEIVSNHMLKRLEEQGLKHFAFEKLGTFKKSTTTRVSFPSADAGGRETAINWLLLCERVGLIERHHLLDLQQARLVPEAVLAIEEAARRYNEEQQAKGGTLLPDSPFSHYEQVTLSVPRSRKG